MSLTTSTVHTDHDHYYKEFERLIADRIASAQEPLFTTNAEGLWEAYLAGIPAEHRQYYNCRWCKRFIEKYGVLAAINADGRTSTSLIWGVDVPRFFLDSAVRCGNILAKAKVTGVFINGDKVWGTPSNVAGVGSKYVGQTWTHLHGTPPTVFKSALKTADQESAEKTQDYITLKRGLDEFPVEAVVQAVRVLEADAVDRSEKTLGVAKWLLALHQSIASLRGPMRDNLVWLAVAKAPPGWCHVRSTMISTLLDDVVQGLPFETIKSRWDAKMHPLKYQRPVAPPKDGAIDAANKIMAKLQSEGALARRFARLDEVTALWRPRTEEVAPAKAKGGAFDHLKGKGGTAIKEVELPAKTMGWNHFRDTVLPDALEIEVQLGWGNLPFYGLTTAVNADAPAIIQWDGLPNLPRNPVAQYFWHGGSPASQWGLTPGWCKVDAICLKPCHWQSDKFSHHGGGVFFVIAAARESRMSGAAIFPETLRAEYHRIRSVIEAHSRQSEIAGMAEGNANGIALDGHGKLTVRVKSKSGLDSYVLSI
jgi:hypothetical protein